jgi:transposase
MDSPTESRSPKAHEELRQQMKKKVGVGVSQSTICRALQAIELTIKKRPSSLQP